MQRSFSFIFLFFLCNALSFSDITACILPDFVASLLRESLYKRQMIHIHVWSTDATHVEKTTKKKLGVLKLKDWDLTKKKKKKICTSSRFISVLLSRVATIDHKHVLWCEKATTPIWITGRYEPRSNTHTQKTVFWSNPSLVLRFTKGIFFYVLFVFKESLQEVLCSFDIQTDKPNSSFRGNDERLVGL